MATLRRALDRELELLAAVKGPLAVATARCGAALSAGASEALSGDAEAELAMAQQHASVVDQEERLAAGAKVLAEATAAMQRLASLSEQKLSLEDEIDGLRRGEDSTEAVEARRAAAVAQMDALAAEAALARATLSDPALRKGLQAHYPEAACKGDFFLGLWPEEAPAEEGAPPCPADEDDSTDAAAPQESEAPSMPPPSTPPPSMPPPSMPPPSTPPPSMPPPSTPPPSIPPPLGVAASDGGRVPSRRSAHCACHCDRGRVMRAGPEARILPRPCVVRSARERDTLRNKYLYFQHPDVPRVMEGSTHPRTGQRGPRARSWATPPRPHLP